MRIHRTSDPDIFEIETTPLVDRASLDAFVIEAQHLLDEGGKDEWAEERERVEAHRAVTQELEPAA